MATTPPRDPHSKERRSSTPRPERTALELDIMRDGGHVRGPRHPPDSVRTVIEFDRGRAATRSVPPLSEPRPPASGRARESDTKTPLDTNTRPSSGELEGADDDGWPRIAPSQRAVTHSVAMPIVSSSADLPTRELPAEQTAPGSASEDGGSRDDREVRWPLPSERVALGRASSTDAETKPPAVAPAPARTVVVAGTTATPPPPLAPPLPNLSVPSQQREPGRTAAPAAPPRRMRVAPWMVLTPLATFFFGIAFALQFRGELVVSFARLHTLVRPSDRTQETSPASPVSVVPAPPTEPQREPPAGAAMRGGDPREAAAVRPEHALTLYVAGQRKEALALYRGLARAHPEARVYAEVARILERELTDKCVRAHPAQADGCSDL